MKTALLALVLLAVFPATARAGDVTMVARDIPLGGRSLQSTSPPIRFDMLGLHWQGAGTVLFRTRSTLGKWSEWVAADDDTGPDTSSPEAGSTWHDGNVVWTSPSTGAQYRVEGTVSRLRAYYLWSRVGGKQPLRSLSIAGSPTIVPRADWQADEKIVRAKPLYARTLRVAVVHHTAGTNDYTEAEAPAIVRGIEVYHVEANGWNDIGYNFLVDRFGTIYEGRAGGVTKNVVGAHAQGFNTGTVGVALIGDFSQATPPPAMQAALVRLLAWRLNIAHVDPLSTVEFRSGGNYKFKAGTMVKLRAISGHRDTGPTECPGAGAYALLPSIATQAAATGLPKLYSPRVTGSVGGDVRFGGQLSSSLPWRVTVTNSAGAVVASGAGTSAVIAWTWDSSRAAGGPFKWSITSSPGLLPAEGSVHESRLPATPVASLPPEPEKPSLLLPTLTVSPAVLNPAGDGTGSTLSATFVVGSRAFVTARVVRGTTSVLSFLAAPLAAGASSFAWNVAALPNGRYTLLVTAQPAVGAAVTESAPFVVDRTLSAFTLSQSTFSPNGDGADDTLTLGFALGQAAPVQITIQRAGAEVATVFAAQLAAGPQSISWDGTSNGVRLADGAYVAVVTESDAFGTVSLLAPFTIDTAAPTMTLLSGSSLRFQLSEAATVTAVVNGETVIASEPAGAFAIPWSAGPVTSFSVQATDAAGNTTLPLSGP